MDEGWLRFDCVNGETVLISDFARLVMELSESQVVTDCEGLHVLLCREYPNLQSAEVDFELRLALDSLTEIGLIKHP